jgi:translocation and assembly module TamA
MCRALLLGLGMSALPGLAQDEGSPDVRISGGDAALRENILAHLQVTREPCSTSLVRLQRLLPQVRRNITNAANALGYYQVQSAVQFSAGTNCWQLDLLLTPGPRVVLESVQLQVLGEPVVQAYFRDLLAATPLRSGAPLHHGEYEALKNALSTTATDNGFFGARFEQAEITVDLQNNTARLALIFDPGLQFRIGTITISRDGNLSDELISGLMSVSEGDYYSSAALAELGRQLDASQYFRQVRVSPLLGQAVQQTVPLQVDLAMRPRHAWTGGLGFSTDTGPRARLGYENRYVNSRGHKLQAGTVVSGVRSQVDTTYVIPLADAARQSLNFAGGYSVEDNDSFESKRIKGEVAVRNENSGGWLQSVFLDFQRDQYIIAAEENTSRLSMLGASLGRTKADNLINPSAGWKLFTQVRGASDSVLSDASFVQLYGSAKHVYSFGRSRLLSRLEVGATWIDVPEDLPASLRYFAGGDQSIRGYDYRSLGPLNDNGEVIGGKQLVAGSVEIDFQVRDTWRVAVFADSGNAFNNSSDVDFRHGVGVGLRWLSPIGPVRIDLAHPLDGDESYRFHITMGPDL